MLACGNGDTGNALAVEHHLSHCPTLRTSIDDYHLRLCLELYVAIFHPSAFAHNGLPPSEGVVVIEICYAGVARTDG